MTSTTIQLAIGNHRASVMTELAGLVHRAQAGDRDALGELFGRYTDGLIRAIRPQLGKTLRARYSAEDLVQEAMLTAIQNFHAFELRGPKSVFNWLLKITENVVRDNSSRLHAKRRDPGRECRLADLTDTDGRCFFEPSSDEPQPFDQLAVRSEWPHLYEALSRLSFRQREVVILRHFSLLPFHRIAQLTGRASADATRMAYRLAVKSLRRLMKSSRATWDGRDRRQLP